MIHSTVEDISPPLSEKSTKTGGPTPAVSNYGGTLQAAYPASPMMGVDPSYNKTHVAHLKLKLMTNQVLEGDIASAAGYFGYSTPESSEESPSSPDLTFDGAPVVPDITTDANGNKIASPYMPNLLPPDSFNPTMDNQTPVIITAEESGAGTTPFVGDGLKSPKASSTKLKLTIQSELEDPNEFAPFLPDGTNSDPLGGP